MNIAHALAGRVLNQLDQEGHDIDPAQLVVTQITVHKGPVAKTDHLILLGQYHLDDARQPPPLHYDLAIQPPLEAA